MENTTSHQVVASKLLNSVSSFALFLALTATAEFAPDVASAQTAANASTVETVTVSASRIARPGYSAPTPTTVIGSDLLESKASVLISEAIFELPSVKPSPNGTGGSQVSGNYINLRGLGNGRTLTLVDGERFVATNAGAAGSGDAVDSNVLPSGIIARVDVVTGGASAAWGSDAVTGVLNIVLKHNIDGVQGNLQYGQSEYVDNKNYAANLAWGSSFDGGKGQFEVAGEYSTKWKMPTYLGRPYNRGQCGYEPGTVNGQAYTAVRTCGLTLSGYTNGGVSVSATGTPLAVGNPLRGLQFLSSTASSTYNYGSPLYSGNNAQLGGDGGWIGQFGSPGAPLIRENIFGRTSYEITPDITAHVDGVYSSSGGKSDTFMNSSPTGSDNGAIPVLSGDPYIPANVQAIMTANKITTIYLGRIIPEFGAVHSKSTNNVWRLSAGLDGSFGKGWTWNAYAEFGHTHYDTHYDNNIIEANFRAALDVVTNPITKAPDCRINVTGAPVPGDAAYGAASGCVPANPFGPGSLASASKYILTPGADALQLFQQEGTGASVQGEPFSDWAGPISVIAGADWRRETINQVASAGYNFTNPPLYGGGGYQNANPKSFKGAVTVTEGFGEVIVPLLKDLPFAKSLDANGAVRFTNYNTSGGVMTWKVGATYAPIEGLLFRAAQSSDIRAAPLFEQYGSNTQYGPQTYYVQGATPGTFTTQTINFVTNAVGNPNLKPEHALTTTVGISSQDLLIEGLGMSVDGYRIFLKDTIGSLGTQGVIDACFGQGTAAGHAPDQSKCSLISLASTHVNNPFFNLGTLYTSGVDIETSYHFPLSNVLSDLDGNMSLRALANYTDHLKTASASINPLESAGDEAGLPNWKVTGSATYSNGPLSVFLEGNLIGGMTRYRYAPAFTFVNPVVGSTFYANASIQYDVSAYVSEIASHANVFFSVHNLLNRDPPYVPGTGTPRASSGSDAYSNAAFYDLVGRTFTFGLRFNM